MTNLWYTTKHFVVTNKWKIATICIALVLFFATLNRVWAAETDLAPLSVTQERLLESGETEFFYTYANVRENEQNDGDHVFGGLWAPFDFVTLSASTTYFDDFNDGFGDIFLSATAEVGNLFGFDVRPSLGVSIPNGFTNNDFFVDDSSGTFDLLPAVTVLTQVEFVTIGAQVKGNIRVGSNPSDFTLGDEYLLTAWGTVQPVDFASVYTFIQAQLIGSPEGVLAVPGSSEAVRVGLGTHGYVENWRVSAEATVPLFENYLGFQNNFDESRVFRFGVQRTF